MKLNSNTSQKAAHLLVRDELVAMQNLGGAAITPLILYPTMRILLQNKNFNAAPKVVADTFCALCNELYLANYKKSETVEKFIMTEWQWAKYYIAPEERKKALKVLEEYKFISITQQSNVADMNVNNETFEISIDNLHGLHKIATQIYDDIRALKR